MKKILGLVLAALVVIAGVGGSTWAYFSDTESSTNNTLSTGTLDLQVDTSAGAGYGNDAVLTYSTPDTIKPDGTNHTGYSKLKNFGTIDASNLKITAQTFADAVVTDLSDDTDIAQDETYLKDHAKMSLYLDLTPNTTWSLGDIGLNADGTVYNYGTGSGGIMTANTNASGVITGITALPVAGGSGYNATTTTELFAVSNGAGTGAVIKATVNGSGAVTGATLVNGGTGYGVSTSFPITLIETASVTTGAYMAVMSGYEGKVWNTGAFAHGAEEYFTITYQFPNAGTDDDNAAQGCSTMIDFTFDIAQ